MLTFEEFQRRIIKDTQAMFPNCEVQTEYVQKAHHDSYDGMLLRPKGTNSGFTIDLSGYYSDFEKFNLPFQVVERKIFSMVENTLPELSRMLIPDFKNYEAVKEMMNVRLISNNGNKDLLTKVPHIDHSDFSEVCYIEFPYLNGRTGATILTTELFEGMDNTPSEEQLFKDAIIQTQKNYPVKISGLGSLVQRMAAEQGIDIPEDNFADRNTLVISNTEGYHGAAAIFYPGILEEAAERLGGSYFMVPSSVHEFLFMKDTGQRIAEINDMIKEINESEVAAEDRLSDTALYYNAETQKIETDREYVVRTLFDFIDAASTQSYEEEELAPLQHRKGRKMS